MFATTVLHLNLTFHCICLWSISLYWLCYELRMMLNQHSEESNCGIFWSMLLRVPLVIAFRFFYGVIEVKDEVSVVCHYQHY